MTHILIIQGHPDKSERHFGHALAEAYEKSARTSGHSVETIEVAKEDIPFLRSNAEWMEAPKSDFIGHAQSAISAADHIVIIYPLWMGTMPAILKAWIEQVFRPGFAFDKDSSPFSSKLKGKSARLVVTMGMPAIVYRWYFKSHSVLSFERNILRFVGIKPVAKSLVGNVESTSGKTRQRALKTMAKLGRLAR